LPCCLIICSIVSDYLHHIFLSNPLHNSIQHLKYFISSLGYIRGIYGWLKNCLFKTINQNVANKTPFLISPSIRHYWTTCFFLF
jgi:hypothetical protein